MKLYVERMYAERLLLNQLLPSQADQVLSWAEGCLSDCTSETEFQRLLDDLRLLNRYVAQKGKFIDIFAMIRRHFEYRGTREMNGGRPESLYPPSYPVARFY